MKVFGVSLLTIALIYGAYVAGRKNLATFIPVP